MEGKIQLSVNRSNFHALWPDICLAMGREGRITFHFFGGAVTLLATYWSLIKFRKLVSHYTLEGGGFTLKITPKKIRHLGPLGSLTSPCCLGLFLPLGHFLLLYTIPFLSLLEFSSYLSLCSSTLPFFLPLYFHAISLPYESMCCWSKGGKSGIRTRVTKIKSCTRTP